MIIHALVTLIMPKKLNWSRLRPHHLPSDIYRAALDCYEFQELATRVYLR